MLEGLLALTLLAAASPAHAGDPAAGEPPVERTQRFDLRILESLRQPPFRPARDSDGERFRVLPLMRGAPNVAEYERPARDETELVAGDLLNLFLDHRGEHVTRAEISPEGWVTLMADDAILAEFDALVDAFTARLSSVPRVRVQQHAGSPGDAESEVVWSRTLSVGPLTSNRASALQSDTVLVDVGVEIAQRAAILAPVVSDALTGFELELAGTPEAGGLRIDYGLFHTTRVDSEAPTRYVATLELSPESGETEFSDAMAWEEDYAVEGGAIAGTMFLPQGRPVVLAAYRGGYTTVELVADPSAPSGAGPVRLGDMAVLFPRDLPLESRHAHVVGMALGIPAPFEAYARDSFFSGDALLARISDIRTTEAAILMGETIEDLTPTPLGYADVIVLPATQLDAYGRHLDFQRRAAEPRMRVEVLEGGTGAVLAQVETVGGTSTLFGLGRETLLVENSDVEVAQGAAVEDPEVLLHFEGAVLELALHPMGNARLAYSARGQLSVDHAFEARPPLIEKGGERCAVRTSIVPFSERGTANATDGVWLIALGDAGRPDAGLSLRVTALP